MASSGTIKSYVYPSGSTTTEGNSFAGAYYSFEWTSEKTGRGETTVSWSLYGKGRTESPQWLNNICYIDLINNNTTTRIYSLGWKENQNFGDGTNTSFNADSDKSLRTTGAFKINHDSSGAASFSIKIEFAAFYSTPTYTTTTSVTLDTNTPYCIISYNANGGNGAPSATTHTVGKASNISSTTPTKANTTSTPYTITFNGNNGTPSKTSASVSRTTSYPFTKWTTNSNGTGTSFTAGQSYTATNTTDFTIYAQYNSGINSDSKITTATATKNDDTVSLTISFNTNGGTAVSDLTSSATRSYSFKGWYSATTGGTYKAAGNTSISVTATETWYAQWTPSIGTYNTVNLPNCTRTGYKFIGWSDGTNIYAAGTNYTPTSPITLIAVWKALIYYKVDNIWTVSTLYTKTNEIWKEASSVQVKNNNIWT